MEIREILELDASSNSIKKIDKFLSEKSPSHRDYPPAIAHLGWLTYQLGDVNGAFKILIPYLDLCDDKQKPVIYNALIKIYYDQKDYDNVLQAIESKRRYLLNYNKAIYYEDLIQFYQTTGNECELVRNILIYLEDDISDERRLKALEILVDVYLKQKDFVHFKEKNAVIKTLAISQKQDNTYKKACYNEAYVLKEEGNYSQSLAIIDELLELNINKDLRSLCLALKLGLLVDLGELRRASIFEAEYEQEVDNGLLEAQINFARNGLKLYTALNNRFNASNYEEKLNNLLAISQKEPIEVKEKKRKALKANIELNFLHNLEKPVDFADKVSSNEEQKAEKSLLPSEKMPIVNSTFSFLEEASRIDNMSRLINDLTKINVKEFREYLRLSFTQVNQLALFDEAYIIIKDSRYLCYHFKKERLYEKNSDLFNTVVLDCFEKQKEIIAENSHETDYHDIISGRVYRELPKQSFLCFPLLHGSLMFWSASEKVIEEKLNYETLKLFTSLINVKVEDYLLKNATDNKYHDIELLGDKVYDGYRRQVDNWIYLSESLMKLFALPMKVSLSEFYTKINSHDLVGYKKIIAELMEKNTDKASYTYRLAMDENCHLRENFIFQDGVIISVVKDISQEVFEANAMQKMAHFDTFTNLMNKSKLDFDLSSLIESKKFSLLALNVIDFKFYSDIYGLTFANQLLLAIGKYLLMFDESKIACYHFDSDKFIIAVPGINDKRTIVKLAQKIADYLTDKLHQLNHRLNVYFEIGILRYPTDTNETDHSKIIEYALSALSRAHVGTIKTNVALYSFDYYKRQVFESQLITHISESIDTNYLKINYYQVVNIKDNSCEHYFVRLNLANYAVDEQLIYQVAERRDLIPAIERYIIHRTIFELSEMYQAVHLFFNVIFKISEKTLLSEGFAQYLVEQLKFFKVPESSIVVKYDGDITPKSIEVLNQIKNANIMIASANAEMLKNVPIRIFFYDLPKNVSSIENDYLALIKAFCDNKSISFIIDNVNNHKVISRYVELGCQLYAGPVYKASLTKDDILKIYLS